MKFRRIYEKLQDAFENVFKFENFIFLGFVGIIFADNYLDFIKSVISIASLQFGLYQSHYRQGKIEANQQSQYESITKLEKLFEKMITQQEHDSRMILEISNEIENKFNTIGQKITHIEEEIFKGLKIKKWKN
jgi:hypothetical protein